MLTPSKSVPCLASLANPKDDQERGTVVSHDPSSPHDHMIPPPHCHPFPKCNSSVAHRFGGGGRQREFKPHLATMSF